MKKTKSKISLIGEGAAISLVSMGMLATLVFGGCAAGEKKSPQIEQILRENHALRTQQKKMQASMDQMEHKILVLESRLVQNQGIPLALQQSDEDIPVIKLKPSEMETPKYSGAKTKAPASVSSKRGLKKKYNDLYSKFKMGDCQDTVLDFDEFAKTYPESSYADNAIYWIGECFYKGNEFRLAISEFEKVPKLYPDGNKAPDAYLRMAMSFKALGDSEQAQQTYLKLLKLYPNTDAAHKAKKVLVDLPVEYGGS